MIRWMINIIRTFQDNGIQEDLHMARIFEQENLQNLNDELQFTQLCIGNITDNFNYHQHRLGYETSMAVLKDFQVEKLKLEIKINTLANFLQG